MANPIRVMLEIGPKGKKVAVVAPDWPGLERGAKTEQAAIERFLSYVPRYAVVTKLAGMESTFETTPVVDLVERYPGIALRQVLRLVVKDQIQRQSQKKDDTLGLIAGIASMLSEQADRRSWLTLPEVIHIADFWMESGVHRVSLGGLGALGSFEGN